MKGNLLFILLLVCGAGLAQGQQLSGRVVIDTVGLSGAHVINQQTGKEVTTGPDGSFSITVKPGQKLVVVSDSTDVREFFISAGSFTQQPYVLGVEPKSYELDVVVIDKTLTAEGLGLVPKGQKHYTAAEKKVLHFQGQQKGLTGVINWLRGRKFLMEIEEKYAEKRVAINVLRSMYTETELVRDFRIPAEFTEAFLFFAVDDEKLAQMLRNDNYGGAKLMLSEVALRYLETIASNEEIIIHHTTDVPAGNGTAAPNPSGEGGGQ